MLWTGWVAPSPDSNLLSIDWRWHLRRQEELQQWELAGV